MPGVVNRELLVHRYAALRDAGAAQCAEAVGLRSAVLVAFRPELRRLARSWSRTAPDASYDAEDLVQEGSIVLLKVLELFRLDAPTPNGAPPRFIDFLGVSVSRRLRDVQRGATRRPSTPLGDLVPYARIDGACMLGVACSP